MVQAWRSFRAAMASTPCLKSSASCNCSIPRPSRTKSNRTFLAISLFCKRNARSISRCSEAGIICHSEQSHLSSMPNVSSNPLALVTELTHRCPLHCVYCSNPLELQSRTSELSTETWSRVFKEAARAGILQADFTGGDRKSTRLNSSHRCISYAVFCLKKKKNQHTHPNERGRHRVPPPRPPCRTRP